MKVIWRIVNRLQTELLVLLWAYLLGLSLAYSEGGLPLLRQWWWVTRFVAAIGCSVVGVITLLFRAMNVYWGDLRD